MQSFHPDAWATHKIRTPINPSRARRQALPDKEEETTPIIMLAACTTECTGNEPPGVAEGRLRVRCSKCGEWEKRQILLVLCTRKRR